MAWIPVVGAGLWVSGGCLVLLSVFVITLFGGLLTALLAALVGLMMWQFNSLGARIDANGARIDRLATELRAELRAEIGSVRADMAELEAGLRAEMQTGFREINLILLDHTDRLARLEARRRAAAPQRLSRHRASCALGCRRYPQC